MSRIPLPGVPGESFFKGLDQGSQMMNRLMQRKQAEQQLGLMQAQEQRTQQLHPYNLKLLEAKARNENNFGGFNQLSGVAKEVASLEMLKNIAGEESDIYKRAKAAHDLQQKHTQETINSSEFYRNNPWRLYDPTTKAFQAQKQAAEGKFPEGGAAYTPEQSEQAVNTYERERYQKNPSFLQQQAIASAQIDETLKLINPEKAFAYSGPQGQIKLWKDRYEATQGKISPEYQAFEEQQSYIHNLVEQIRTYYGSSIAPSMTDNLNYLVNPNNWINHPKIAIAKYEAVKRAYEKEKETTQRAAEKGNPFGQQAIFENTKGNEAQIKAATPGLNIKPEALTEANILKTAKEKKWSQEKTEWVLNKFRNMSNG